MISASPTHRSLVVSLHDVHPGSQELIREQIEVLATWGVSRTSLLVVPEFHHGPAATDPVFAGEVSAWAAAGHEIVLHGYYHDRRDQPDRWRDLFWTRLYTSREAEFLDLTPDEARTRLTAGLALFRQAGWTPTGFIAPAWLMSPSLPQLLGELGFLYTNIRTELIPTHGSPLPCPSLCYSTRALWRRSASLIWNHGLAACRRGDPLIRLSLHPHDLRFPGIRRQIEAIVRRLLAAGYEPATYAAFVSARMHA